MTEKGSIVHIRFDLVRHKLHIPFMIF
jgi:hypothetical protein